MEYASEEELNHMTERWAVELLRANRAENAMRELGDLLHNYRNEQGYDPSCIPYDVQDVLNQFWRERNACLESLDPGDSA